MDAKLPCRPADVEPEALNPYPHRSRRRTSASAAADQEGFIPVKDAPLAHAPIGSQRRDAGFRQRLNTFAEQSKYATSCRNADTLTWNLSNLFLRN